MKCQHEVRLEGTDKNVTYIDPKGVGVGIDDDGNLVLAVMLQRKGESDRHFVFPISRKPAVTIINNLTLLMSEPVGAA